MKRPSALKPAPLWSVAAVVSCRAAGSGPADVPPALPGADAPSPAAAVRAFNARPWGATLGSAPSSGTSTRKSWSGLSAVYPTPFIRYW